MLTLAHNKMSGTEPQGLSKSGVVRGRVTSGHLPPKLLFKLPISVNLDPPRQVKPIRISISAKSSPILIVTGASSGTGALSLTGK